MTDNSRFTRILEGVFINGLYDIIKLLFVGAVVALVVAVWQRIKHVPIDWWGILALSLFVCVLFALMLRLHPRHAPAPAEALAPAQAQPPAPHSIQINSDPMTPLLDGLMHGGLRALRINGKGARFTWLNAIEDTFFEPEKRSRDSHKALIAEFRNEPGQLGVPTWYGVMASIAYYDINGEERADVGRATWLETLSVTVGMESQKTYELIVALKARDSWISFDSGIGVSLPKEIRRARITLHDGGKFSMPWMLEFDWNTWEAGPLHVEGQKAGYDNHA